MHYEKLSDGSIKCIEDEIPFELPKGWAWCRFSTLTINRDKERRPLSAANRTGVEQLYDFYGASGKIDKIDRFIFDEKLLLIGEDGTNLVTRNKPIAFLAEGRYWVNNHAHCIDAVDKFILEYLCMYINAINLEKYVTGSAQPKMTQVHLNSILVSLPPYNEQKRLNRQLHKMLKLVDVIEAEKRDMEEMLGMVKSKLLNLAVRGQLVAQNPNDEPAPVLLNHMRAEKEELIKQGKIKRDKKESVIFQGEDSLYYETTDNCTTCIEKAIPFELPKGWTWCRLKSITAPHKDAFVDGPSGRNLKTEHYTENREVRIIQLNNIGELSWKNKGIKYTTFEHAKTLERCISYPGDIVIAKMTPAGRAVLIPDTESIYVISPDCIRLQLPDNICNEYIMYMLNSPLIHNRISSTVQGVGRSRTSLNKLKELLIPLPPYHEQIRIAAACKNAFTHMDIINTMLF